jgi:hypothetical protein
MKTKVVIQVYSDQDELLSEVTQEIIKTEEEADRTSTTGLSGEDYRKANQALDQAELEARLKRSFF